MADSKPEISIQSGYVLVEDPPDYDVVWSEQPPKLRAISAACVKARCSKVLIRGTRANVKLTPAEGFDLGELVAKLKLTIAVVNSHDAPRENVEFLENVGTNRGGPIRFFDNEEDARDWLGV